MVQINKIPFKSLLNRDSEDYKINSGQKVYEWEYLDENNEIQKDKKDMYEYIQSFEASTNILARIKREEGEENGKGVYLDATKLGDNPHSINEYLGNLVSSIQKELIKNERISNTKEVGEDSKKNAENELQSGEIDRKGEFE